MCMLGCDLAAVTKTGIDPCKAESIKDGSLSNSPFSCFDLGPGMMGGWGACGYNCTAYQPAHTEKLVGCTKEEMGEGKCYIYCDSRTFPTEPQSEDGKLAPKDHVLVAEGGLAIPPAAVNDQSHQYTLSFV